MSTRVYIEETLDGCNHASMHRRTSYSRNAIESPLESAIYNAEIIVEESR